MSESDVTGLNSFVFPLFISSQRADGSQESMVNGLMRQKDSGNQRIPD